MLLDALTSVRRELTRLSVKYRGTACIARTHGQHAIPITMGFKFANFLYEMTVAQAMLDRVEVRACGRACVGVVCAREAGRAPPITHHDRGVCGWWMIMIGDGGHNALRFAACARLATRTPSPSTSFSSP